MKSLPKSQELVLPLVELLKNAGKPLSIEELEKGICDLLGIPSELQQLVHSGSRTELQYRLAWARTKAKGLGLISREKPGYWESTKH
jgi:restriction system protein